MNETSQKVYIKLIDIGNREQDVLFVLSKIQGLTDSPEQLIRLVPCRISGKVSLATAEKVKAYLEKAGASIVLEEEERTRSAETMTLPPGREELRSLLSQEPTYQVNAYQESGDETFYEASEIDSTIAEAPTLSPDTLPGTPIPVESMAYQRPAPEPYYDVEPVVRRRPFKKKKPNTSVLLTAGVGLVIVILVGAGMWLYFSGGVSNFSQQYEQNPLVGIVGTLEIENNDGAAIILQHVVGTRVFEQIPLEGAITRLPQGDYYVEAQKGAQTLRYPVYIKGRGHSVKVSVSFPTDGNIPENMAYIPAGRFRMGNKETAVAHFGFPDEKPDIDIYVDAFFMSKYEVTNREFLEFVEAGGYENRLYWETFIADWDSLVKQVPSYGDVYGNDGWNSVSQYIWTRLINTDNQPGPRLWEDDEPPYEYGQDDHPVFGITFYEADAYCKWFSGQTGKLYRLPTEAEWEKAARGYEGYFFAYGNEYDASRANTETQGTKKVGSYPPTGFGVFDLTGNVWEWVSDHYQADAYQHLDDTYRTEIRNPHIFDETQRYNRRIVRGGSFRSVNQINAKTTIRYPMFPNFWHTNIGFRYVTTP